MKKETFNLKLTKDQVKSIISYLDMAYEKAQDQQLPLTQDNIKNTIKMFKKL